MKVKKGNEMNSFKITTKHDTCDIALQWLREKTVIGADGKWTISLESNLDMLHSMAVDELLIWSITIQPALEEFSKALVVRNAIDRWLRFKKYRNNSNKIRAFEESLSIELRSISQNADHKLVGFINLRPENYFLEKLIKVNEINLEFAPWSRLNNTNFEDLINDVTEHLPKHIATLFSDAARMVSTFTPVFITIKSYSKDDALQIVQKKFNLLRVAMNFSSATALLIRYGEAFPLSKFVESPIWFFMDSNSHLSFAAYTTTDIQSLQTQTMSEDEYSKVLSTISRINESKGIWKLLTDLLYLYQEALDLSENQEVYLALWRVLEAAVLDNPRHSVNISALVGSLTDLEKDPILKHNLDMLASHRNDLVHGGTFPSRNNDAIFLLKKIVDITLGKIIQLTKDINDEIELRDYLALISTNNTDLARKAKIIGLLQSTREKKNA